jgi:dihydroorotase
MQLIKLMSTKPASLLGLQRDGFAPGQPADVALFDITNPYTINRDEFFSKSANTPFHGNKVYGRTKMTVCGGKITYEEGNL